MLKILFYILSISVVLFIGYCVWILLKELVFRILLAVYKHIQSNRYANDSHSTDKNKSIKMTNQWVNQHVTNIVINYGIDHKKQQEVEIIEPEECSDEIEGNDIKRLKPPLDSLPSADSKKRVSDNKPNSSTSS